MPEFLQLRAIGHMKTILLITGGARSGKSRYAERRALAIGQKLLYLATAEALDSEMAGRIEEHRRTRASNWLVIEEPLEVSIILNEHASQIDCALIDCLTLWVSNLLINRGEEALEEQIRLLVDRMPTYNCSLIFVTNEVGSGIVPDSLLARRFRDFAGRTNQRISELADEVIFMVAGIPVTIKPWTE